MHQSLCDSSDDSHLLCAWSFSVECSANLLQHLFGCHESHYPGESFKRSYFHLSQKSSQSTAKGTLTQMLNMVFHRLERQSQEQVRRRDVALEVVSDIISKVVGEPIKEVCFV